MTHDISIFNPGKNLNLSKNLSITIILFLSLYYKFPVIDQKQNFIINKFYLFFITFVVSILFDVINNHSNSTFSDIFSLSIFTSLIVVIAYGFFTDFAINGALDDYDHQRDKILLFVFIILVTICSVDLINTFF